MNDKETKWWVECCHFLCRIFKIIFSVYHIKVTKAEADAIPKYPHLLNIQFYFLRYELIGWKMTSVLAFNLYQNSHRGIKTFMESYNDFVQTSSPTQVSCFEKIIRNIHRARVEFCRLICWCFWNLIFLSFRLVNMIHDFCKKIFMYMYIHMYVYTV